MFPPALRMERIGFPRLCGGNPRSDKAYCQRLRYEPDRHHDANDCEGSCAVPRCLSFKEEQYSERSVGKDAIVVSCKYGVNGPGKRENVR